MEIFWDIMYFTVTFDQFNASLLNVLLNGSIYWKKIEIGYKFHKWLWRNSIEV